MSADVRALVEGLVAAFEEERPVDPVEGDLDPAARRRVTVLNSLDREYHDALLASMTKSEWAAVDRLLPLLSAAVERLEKSADRAFWRLVDRADRRLVLGLGARKAVSVSGQREARLPRGQLFPFDSACWYGRPHCSCLTAALDHPRWRELGRAGVGCLARRRHVGPRVRVLPNPAASQTPVKPRFVPNPPRRRPEPPSYGLGLEPVVVVPEKPRQPVVRRARPSQAEALARVAAATGLTVYDGRQHSVHSTFTRRQR